MDLSFVETMRGELETPDGGRARVDFHVRAAGGARGRFRLEGVVHAAPWADETTGEGSLELSVLPAAITYDVRFTAADGRRLRLHGHKSPSLLRPVHSMTVLPIALSDEGGAELARGTLTFDLLDLPDFLRSMLPGPSAPHRRLEARRAAVARVLRFGREGGSP